MTFGPTSVGLVVPIVALLAGTFVRSHTGSVLATVLVTVWLTVCAAEAGQTLTNITLLADTVRSTRRPTFGQASIVLHIELVARLTATCVAGTANAVLTTALCTHWSTIIGLHAHHIISTCRIT